MASSGPNEKSWIGDESSLFTEAVASAIRGDAKHGRGGCLTLNDIAVYIDGKLVGQTPYLDFMSQEHGIRISRTFSFF